MLNKIGSILFIFFVYLFSQVVTYYQLQGHLFNKWIKNHPLIVAFLGFPVGYLVILATRELVELFDGQTWPSRIIGFVFGVVVFSFMSWYILKEPLTLKTIICIFLCFVILCIQLFWK